MQVSGTMMLIVVLMAFIVVVGVMLLVSPRAFISNAINGIGSFFAILGGGV
ncbi:MAG: hypothetical protein ABIG30_03890 [Candidatus Aenigmatarchaeota archaeon]